MDIVQLVAEHHQAVYGYAYRLTGRAADAEDLTQQVFLKAQARIGQLRNVSSARSWLFSILRRRFLKMTHQRKPIPATLLDLNVESIPARPPNAEEIDREALQRALDELPPAHRMVVTMFYYEQCSYREIAEKLHVPIGTVMSRLARAKAHLRATLLAADAAGDGHIARKRAIMQG